MAVKNWTQVAVKYPNDLIVRARRILYWSPKGRTFTSIVIRGLMMALEEIEQAENRGSPFKPIPAEKPEPPPSEGKAVRSK